VLWAFAIALGEDPDVFTRHATKTPSQLRLVHYPYNADAEDHRGIGAHTDYECFTLLKPTAPGLEVLNRAGDWIDVPPVPGTFVATSHPVRKVKEERYSFPLFFNVDYHTTGRDRRGGPVSTCSPRPRSPSPICAAGSRAASWCCPRVVGARPIRSAGAAGHD
jgi:hypothetical protein